MSRSSSRKHRRMAPRRWPDTRRAATICSNPGNGRKCDDAQPGLLAGHRGCLASTGLGGYAVVLKSFIRAFLAEWTGRGRMMPACELNGEITMKWTIELAKFVRAVATIALGVTLGGCVAQQTATLPGSAESKGDAAEPAQTSGGPIAAPATAKAAAIAVHQDARLPVESSPGQVGVHPSARAMRISACRLGGASGLAR